MVKYCNDFNNPAYCVVHFNFFSTLKFFYLFFLFYYLYQFIFSSFGPFINFIFISTRSSRKSKEKKMFLVQLKCSMSFVDIFQYWYAQEDNYTHCLVPSYMIFCFRLIIYYLNLSQTGKSIAHTDRFSRVQTSILEKWKIKNIGLWNWSSRTLLCHKTFQPCQYIPWWKLKTIKFSSPQIDVCKT